MAKNNMFLVKLGSKDLRSSVNKIDAKKQAFDALFVV
jgi:hypothetical protein